MPVSLSTVVLVLSLLIVAINLLFGLWRGGKRSVLRLITQAFSALLALFIARGAASGAADRIAEVVQRAMASNEDLAVILQENPEVVSTVGMIGQMIAAPLLFFGIYLVLKLVTFIVYFIVSRVVEFFAGKPKGMTTRLVGLGVGVVSAVVSLVVLLCPLLGYSDVVGQTLQAADEVGMTAPAESGETGDGEDADIQDSLDQANELLGGVVDTPIAGWAYKGLGGRAIFGSLTTVRWGEEKDQKSSLLGEMTALVDLYGTLKPLQSASFTAYGDEQVQALHDMSDAVGESRLASVLLPAALRSLANAWEAGDAFMGMEKPATNEDEAILLDGFIAFFKEASSDTVREDLNGVGDLFAVLVEHHVFSSASDETAGGESFMDSVSSLAFLDDLRATIKRYPRMKPLMDAVSDVGIRRLNLALFEDSEVDRDAVFDEMAQKLKAYGASGAVTTEQLEKDLQAALEKENVQVADDVMKLVAEGLIAEFTDENGTVTLGDLTEQEIRDRLVARFDAVDAKSGT